MIVHADFQPITKFIVAAMLLLCSLPAFANPVQDHGRLQVKGNQIVGKHGGPVSLAGMSLFWSQWMPQFYNRDTVAWLKKDWQITVVRAAVAVEPDGYLKNPEVEFEKACQVVDAAVAEGLYVIVDWHDHKAEEHTAQSVEFFDRLSKKYANVDNIIYEIYNEPLKVSWAEVIKPYSIKVINAIRKNDPDNLIVAGTPTWSQDVDVAAADPIKDVNLAYTLHFYAGTHKADLRAKAQKALNAGIALFVTEWGTVEASGDGAVDRESVAEWVQFMQKNNLSHCNWSIADKVEGAAVLKPGASPKGGWADTELTESGMFVRELIRSWGRRE